YDERDLPIAARHAHERDQRERKRGGNRPGNRILTVNPVLGPGATLRWRSSWRRARPRSLRTVLARWVRSCLTRARVQKRPFRLPSAACTIGVFISAGRTEFGRIPDRAYWRAIARVN